MFLCPHDVQELTLIASLIQLWNKSPEVIRHIPNIDLSDVMKQYRFQLLLGLLPKAMEGDDPSDPYNGIMGMVHGFNNNRAQNIASSHCKVMDEMMSSWKPRTTKYGGLPFLSFIMRKPKPLGTEFKNVACSETGEYYSVVFMSHIMMHLLY